MSGNRRKRRPKRNTTRDLSLFTGTPTEVFYRIADILRDHLKSEDGESSPSFTEHCAAIDRLLNVSDVPRRITFLEYAMRITKEELENAIPWAEPWPRTIDASEIAHEAVLAFFKNATKIKSTATEWLRDFIKKRLQEHIS